MRMKKKQTPRTPIKKRLLETTIDFNSEGPKEDSPTIASSDIASPDRSLPTNLMDSKDRLSLSKEKMR